jgi:hypothetical protein
MNAASLERFNAIAAKSLVDCWPVTITTAAGVVLSVGKSATSIRRRPAEHGTGFIRRSECSYLFPQAVAFRPDVGTTFTLTTTAVVAEVGTSWRCFALGCSPRP